MAQETLTPELVKKLMAFEGKIRGMDLKIDGEFILKTEGKENFEKLKEKLIKIGVPNEYQYDKIKSLDFYPGGLKAISLLAIKEVLGYDDEKIQEIGMIASKSSLIVRIFIKYFLPISDFFFKKGPTIWDKYWTVGKFTPLDLNEKEKFALVRIEGLDLHPVYCSYLKGYFTTLTKMVTGGSNIICQETKCSFRGDKVHEFLLKW